MINSSITHRKFLRNPAEYEIGNYIPDKIKLSEYEEKDFSRLKKNRYGTILLFLSKNCTACDLQVAIRSINLYKPIECHIFLEGYTEDEVDSLRKENNFDGFYGYQADILSNEIGIKVVPYLLVLNSIAQVIVAGVFNTDEHVKEMAAPLLERLYE